MQMNAGVKSAAAETLLFCMLTVDLTIPILYITVGRNFVRFKRREKGGSPDITH